MEKLIKYESWKIKEVTHSKFTASNNDYIITFECEYKNGVYFNIVGVYDINKDRHYTSQRYFYKYIPLINEISFELLKNDMLWDYINSCKALVTYKKDITPYYNKCIKNNMSFYSDSEFLHKLFN